MLSALLLMAMAQADLYNSSGELKFPAKYREWVWLGSGLGMTYGPAAPGPGVPKMFDNVFVNPEAYRAFLEKGVWPEGTVLVLEVRNSESQGSINQGGHYQTDLGAIEVEVKDSKHPQGKWNFYDFRVSNGKPAVTAKAIGPNSSCHQCHSKKGAVDNTFVQFYPTLYSKAREHGTVRADFPSMPPSSNELVERIQLTAPADLAGVLDQVAMAFPQANVFMEGPFFGTAMRVMREVKVSSAVAMFQWAAMRHPGSAVLQDGLAQALLASGDKIAAKAATKKALALLQADSASPEMLRKAIEDRAKARLKEFQ